MTDETDTYREWKKNTMEDDGCGGNEDFYMDLWNHSGADI